MKKENTSCEIKKTITKAQSPYRNNKKKQVKIEKKRGFQEEIKLIQDRALKNIGNQMSSQAKIPILMSKSRISKEKSKKEQILEKHAGVDYQLTENYAKKRSLSLSETKVYKL